MSAFTVSSATAVRAPVRVAARTVASAKIARGAVLARYTVTLETPEGTQAIECADDTYILDAAEVRRRESMIVSGEKARVRDRGTGSDVYTYSIYFSPRAVVDARSRTRAMGWMRGWRKTRDPSDRDRGSIGPDRGSIVLPRRDRTRPNATERVD